MHTRTHTLYDNLNRLSISLPLSPICTFRHIHAAGDIDIGSSDFEAEDVQTVGFEREIGTKRTSKMFQSCTGGGRAEARARSSAAGGASQARA
jgi:hypothetical protein